jgi:hypothetical protein
MEILGFEQETTAPRPSVEHSSKRCAICPRVRDRIGRHQCIKCRR